LTIHLNNIKKSGGKTVKKLLLIAVILLCCVSVGSTAGITLKGMLGYGFLLSPSLPDISGISGASSTKGGFSFNVQGLFGEGALRFGGQLGYLSIYSMSYEQPAIEFMGTVISAASTWESKLSAIPILGLVQYDLGDAKASFRPFLQGGLGFYMASVTASSGGVSASTSEVDFGIKLGVGGDLQLSPQMDLEFSANYYNIFVTGGASTLNIEAGIAYKI
jgi:hypothetical protein